MPQVRGHGRSQDGKGGREAQGGHLRCYNQARSADGVALDGGSRGFFTTITAKYEDGVFKPLEHVNITEGTLVEVCVPAYADRLKVKAPSVGESSFHGMWRDRTDIGDSVEHMSNLRRELRS